MAIKSCNNCFHFLAETTEYGECLQEPGCYIEPTKCCSTWKADNLYVEEIVKCDNTHIMERNYLQHECLRYIAALAMLMIKWQDCECCYHSNCNMLAYI